MTTPLLEGLDARLVNGKIVGKKMSKSADNYVGVLEPAPDQLRKLMQVDDDVIFRYFELLSARTTSEIETIKAERAAGRDPRTIKAELAREIVTRFHGREAAERAEREFQSVYAADAIPADVPTHTLTTEGPTLWIAKALAGAGLVKTTSEGKRLVEQGGVEVDRSRVTDVNLQLERGKKYLLKVGSKNRRFAYVVVAL
jgi:tyrosyl-tRNA synthetase